MKAQNFLQESDESLVARFKSGEQSAFGELYNRHNRQVFHRCLEICKDKDLAYDLSQEVMMKAFHNIAAFRAEAKFSSWLYVIATRHCLMHLRKSKSSSIVERIDEERLAENETLAFYLDDEDGQAIMLTLLNNLPESERQLLRSKYEKGETIEALQTQLQLSESAVKMRLKRSKEKLNAVYSLALTFGVDYAINFLSTM